MERVMTLDEEDIIRLIAKSVGVEVEAVKIKTVSDIVLHDEGEDEPGLLDCGFRFYAKVNLPVTQIDGTVVEDTGELDFDSGDEDDGNDEDN